MKPSDILRRIWGLALPNILSNVTVPLLMLADTAMAGRMATADSIAAVAIGAAITQFRHRHLEPTTYGHDGLYSSGVGRM